MEDSCGWDSKHGILSFREMYISNLGWKLTWIPRTANISADSAAKWARTNHCNLAISDCFECVLPFFILNLLSEERTWCPPLV